MIVRPKHRRAGLELGPEDLLSLHTAISDSLLWELDGALDTETKSAHVQRLERIRKKVEEGMEYVKGNS